MPGTFIISLDCEDYWGIADNDRDIATSFITESGVFNAYNSIIKALALYEAPATFAFVMALTLKKGELLEWIHRLTDIQVDGANWMRNFRRSQSKGSFEGWFCPDAFELVRDIAMHEIACHGFRHVPIGNRGVASEDVRYELAGAGELARRKGIQLRTFVFPRNQIGHLDLLVENGYRGFRNIHPLEGRHGRPGNLIRELNVREKSQDAEPLRSGLVSIPGGYFLNWKRGFRRLVPEAATLLRWRSILNDAVANDRVALLYLHPHNLISGPRTLELFCGVLRIASKLRNLRGLKITTQADYCGPVATSAQTGVSGDCFRANLHPPVRL